MAAHAYPALLARVVAGELDPSAGIGRRVRLDELPDALVEMSAAPTRAGFTIAEL
jgi:alcohol dehydrogenase